MNTFRIQGRIQGERTRPKIGKNKIFWRKIVIFHTKYLKNFRASLRNWKNMIFWHKIVIFHTKYPNNFCASLRSAQFFLSLPPLPNLKSWNMLFEVNFMEQYIFFLICLHHGFDIDMVTVDRGEWHILQIVLYMIKLLLFIIIFQRYSKHS
jgi:hypothetical protein